MEVAPTFFAHPSELALLDLLRRRLRDGEIAPWIHNANVYGGDPVAITARYAPATAANGTPAWYFVCTPQKKKQNDPRITRMAGSGTWKGERGQPLVSVSGGVHEQVGWKRTFSYIIKAQGKKAAPTRLGWIMLEIKLADGTATCLCKMYRSPRTCKDQLAKALNLSLTPPPQEDAPESTPAPLMASSSSGTTLGPATQITSGLSLPQDTADTNPVFPLDAPTAAADECLISGLSSAVAAQKALTSGLSSPPPPIDVLATSSSASTIAPPTDATTSLSPPATAETSPPKKWVQVEISDSPTRASDKSSAKRVYRMMHPAEEGLAPFSAKKPRPMDCKGWLTIEPVRGTDSPIA